MSQHRVGEMKKQRLPNEIFAMQADPLAWLRTAKELHRSALLLADQFAADGRDIPRIVAEQLGGGDDGANSSTPGVLNQFTLLAAFCLENLFKGLVLCDEPQLIEGGRITGILGSHDLIPLAARATVELDANEERFCELASSASVGWGRYPISRTANESVASITVTSSSFGVFDRLVQRAEALLLTRYPTRIMRVQTPEGEKFMRGVVPTVQET